MSPTEISQLGEAVFDQHFNQIIDVLSYFATDIERGIQIFWTVNRRAISEWKIVRSVAAIFFFLNNFSMGNGSAIRHSKDLNATFNVGGKSNWVRPLSNWVVLLS